MNETEWITMFSIQRRKKLIEWKKKKNDYTLINVISSHYGHNITKDINHNNVCDTLRMTNFSNEFAIKNDKI